MTARHFSLIHLIVLALASNIVHAVDSPKPETYNGIIPPDVWPPKIELTRKPLAVPPYIASPPAVILIDVGRQLFVDDFLVESTTLTRTHHLPEYYSGNPVLKPDQPWEHTTAPKGKTPARHAAMFSDGVWFDPADRLFKMWYWAGSPDDNAYGGSTCLATSQDGIHWERPMLDVVPGTNIVLLDEPRTTRNSSTVWLDLAEKDPARRYKMFRNCREAPIKGKPGSWHLYVAFSPDGVHWTVAGKSDSTGDRTTVFHNPFRDAWVASLRKGDPKTQARCRGYYEDPDPLAAMHWEKADHTSRSVLWVGADELDPDRADLDLNRPANRPFDLTPSQLYNLDCVAYESVMLGLFTIWRGQPITRPKINEVCVGYSRDGFHWSRPDRRAFCPVSEDKGAWNWGNVQSAGGCCLIVGDKLHFYVGGVGMYDGRYFPDPVNVGLATLRRDGFTSMDATDAGGMLMTRPVRFTGKYLFVNVAAAQGALRVEALDEQGNPIGAFTKENCQPVTADKTLQRITWKAATDLSPLIGKPVRFRFHLSNGKLYAFWVSKEESGASNGYVAAGGPGFTGATDTIGAK